MTGPTRATDVVACDEHALVQRFRLAAIAGTDDGQVFESAGERVTIGSDAAAQLVLRDRAVSRLGICRGWRCDASPTCTLARRRPTPATQP